MFKTEEELLRHFVEGNDLLDKEDRTVYIADCNGEGEFFGIMVAIDIPEDSCDLVEDAVEYAFANRPAPGTGAYDRMEFMEAPGEWFGELAEEVLAYPEKFLA